MPKVKKKLTSPQVVEKLKLTAQCYMVACEYDACPYDKDEIPDIMDIVGVDQETAEAICDSEWGGCRPDEIARGLVSLALEL